MRSLSLSLLLSLALSLAAWGPVREAAAITVTFSAEQTVASGLLGGQAVEPADLDGDGDLDLVTISFTGGRVLWHRNLLGDASAFAEIEIDATLGGLSALWVADLDGDGPLDVIAAGVAGTVRWYRNTAGDGTSWQAQDVSVVEMDLLSVHAADVDGDADMDLLSAAGSSGVVAWHENANGAGTVWTRHVITATLLQPRAVRAGDVDDDGAADVVVAVRGEDRVVWLANDLGDGTQWTEHPIAANTDRVLGVDPVDVDGDGRLDVLSASEVDRSVRFHRNVDGAGTQWTTTTVHQSASIPFSIRAVDIDMDGDLDAVSAIFSLFIDQSWVDWYDNVSGDGTTWVRRRIGAVGLGTRWAAPGDLDGDGRPDVARLGLSADLQWHRNLGPDLSKIPLLPAGAGVLLAGLLVTFLGRRGVRRG